MKNFLLAVVSVAAVGVAPAIAADLPVKYKAPPVVAPVYNWSGFYIGLNAGGGQASKCWDLDALAGAVLPTVLQEGCHHATGGTFGGQIGYRWQMPANWVFGIEAQGNWADFRGSNLNSLDGTLFRAGLTDESKVKAFGLFTGQIGIAFDNNLIYFKGGAAVTSDRYDTFVVTNNLFIDSARETRWGGALGLGYEYGITPSWSIAIEYDHLFMEARDVNAFSATGAFSATDHIRQDVDIGMVKVNYHFNSPIVAKF